MGVHPLAPASAGVGRYGGHRARIEHHDVVLLARQALGRLDEVFIDRCRRRITLGGDDDDRRQRPIDPD
jgi:hypothetical protein